jgi:hypothetical protein
MFGDGGEELVEGGEVGGIAAVDQFIVEAVLAAPLLAGRRDFVEHVPRDAAARAAGSCGSTRGAIPRSCALDLLAARSPVVVRAIDVTKIDTPGSRSMSAQVNMIATWSTPSKFSSGRPIRVELPPGWGRRDSSRRGPNPCPVVQDDLFVNSGRTVI